MGVYSIKGFIMILRYKHPQLKYTLLPIPKTRIGLELFNAPQKILLI